MRVHASILAAALAAAPLGVQAADLVVWWEKGYYDQEDEAVRDTIAAFEQEAGKKVELVFQEQADFPSKVEAALAAGRPPDFAFGFLLADYVGTWAIEGRLANLSEVVGHFSDLFDPDTLAWVTWRDAETGRPAIYGLPIGREIDHVHIWKNILETAGFTTADIPKQWDAFWQFWCDEVQPAARRATVRKDIWGIALPMSRTGDTVLQFLQFVTANDADYVTDAGRLVIDDPEIRRKLTETMDSYTTIYRTGCTPPNSVTWSDIDNNKAFWSKQVVMVPNVSLSIPNALKREHPDDYYSNTATIEWPLGPDGEPFPIVGDVVSAIVFKGGGHSGDAVELVRFLVAEGWLAHYLDFSAERLLPPMSKLINQPFWLDPSDPHRMASVMQVSSRSLAHGYAYAAISGNWRHQLVNGEYVWGNAVHRVVADGVSPEQAVDEAIARIKQILNE
jgi:multiple sugar transport system substrate-binding protein